LARMREVIDGARASGATVVLDLHNYGRYRLKQGNQARTVIIDEQIDGAAPVPRAAFADVWRRLAAEFASEPTVVGLGLMNEPHDMKSSDWKGISQAAVDAVREVNRTAWVVVAGDGWSNAHRFEQVNGPRAWIRDAANRVIYEAHCYFDGDASGKYRRSFAAELRDDPQLAERGVARLSAFLDWCRRNQVAGFIGEFGIPGDDAGWQEVLSRALAAIEQANVSACYWAAGEWWHDYPLSIQPRNDMRDPAPQQQILIRALANRATTSRPF
jgi:endoglucanase